MQASCSERQKAEWSQAAITLQSSWDQIKQRKHGEVGGVGKIEILFQKYANSCRVCD